MRALLDENRREALLHLLAPAVEVRTVQQEGWSGRKNGDLLTTASASFDVLVTTDQGIPHQQNLNQYDIGIILMEARSNRIEDLAPLVPDVIAALAAISPGVLVRVSA